MSEKTIAFSVDEELHKEIKIRIAETGQFLKGYIISLIREDLKNAKLEDPKKEYTIADAIKKEQELSEILYIIAEKEKK